MRATTKGISSCAGVLAFHAAKVLTSFSATFFPSQLRSTDSSTMRILTGKRWQDLFGARFEVLLYDLTSTYFESDPVFEETDKRQFAYSRDKRSDCVQVVIALIITPEGFPLAEVLPGNTSDKTTLGAFFSKIEEQYGKAERVWLMDRGIPTEEVLSEMR